MDDFLDLDAMFASAALEEEKQQQNQQSQKEMKAMPAGSLVKIRFKPGSCLGRALALSTLTSPTALDELLVPTDIYIHGLLINHSPKLNSIQIRLYDLNKPYNVQSQNMVLINLNEVEQIEFIALVLQSTRLEVLADDVIQLRVDQATERRLKSKALINSTASPTGQELMLFLAARIPKCMWYEDKIVVSDKFCVSPPYSIQNISGFDMTTQKPFTDPNINTDFIKGLILTFEHEQSQKKAQLAAKKEEIDTIINPDPLPSVKPIEPPKPKSWATLAKQ